LSSISERRKGGGETRPLSLSHLSDDHILTSYHHVSQERPRPLFFAIFPPLSSRFPRHTGLVRRLGAPRRPAANANVTPMALSCHCHAAVMPCQCHVNVASVPRQALSNPGPAMSCKLRFSGNFSVFPAASAAFQTDLSVSTLTHACVHMIPCRLCIWTIVSPPSCINRGLPALPVPHLSLLGSWAHVSRPLYQCR
jgi:hypothetical protein